MEFQVLLVNWATRETEETKVFRELMEHQALKAMLDFRALRAREDLPGPRDLLEVLKEEQVHRDHRDQKDSLAHQAFQAQMDNQVLLVQEAYQAVLVYPAHLDFLAGRDLQVLKATKVIWEFLEEEELMELQDCLVYLEQKENLGRKEHPASQSQVRMALMEALVWTVFQGRKESEDIKGTEVCQEIQKMEFLELQELLACPAIKDLLDFLAAQEQ